MSVRRRYSVTVNGDLFVIDWPGDPAKRTDISGSYTTTGSRIGRTEVWLNVEAGSLAPDVYTNGVGTKIAGEYLLELLRLYTDDLDSSAPVPRRLT